MSATDRAIALIKEFEGFAAEAYLCPAGVWTIGYGTTLYPNGESVESGRRIDQSAADYFLSYDLNVIFIPTLTKTIPGWAALTLNQQAALISFAYNCGAHFYNSDGFATISQMLRDRAWERAPKVFGLYTNGGMPGLVRRRQAEADLFLAGLTMSKTKLRSSPKRPDLKPNDVHVIVNDWEDKYIGEIKCFAANGKLRWQAEALCKGVEGPRWDSRGGDTPPGLYKAGELTETRSDEPQHIWNAYGRYFIDMIECENQEANVGRSGIGCHGGGTAAPEPLAPRQQLVPTLGCVRLRNEAMEKLMVPTLREVRAKGGIMWITVNQLG